VTAPPRSIVIADPEPEERERLVRLVEAAAAERAVQVTIRAASDGHEALAVIERERPSLVVTEILLPGMNGLALLRRLRERGGAPLFLYVTGMARESDRYWALRNGAHSYVIKPYEDAALQARLAQVLGEDAEPDRLGLL
jgi:two-component system OmpR family response regulator